MKYLGIAKENQHKIEDANGIIVIDASSEEEAIAKYNELFNPIIIKKEQLVDEAKNSAKSYLDATDYIVQRHIEETELGVTTTLSKAEYTALLTKRNQARIDSNTEEATIKAKTDITELEAIKITEKGK